MNPYLAEDEHRYWDRDTGAELAGVTSTLGRVGVSTDYAGIPDHVLEHASARGTAAHLATVYDDDGTLDEASVDDEVRPYLDAWRRLRADTPFRVVHAELLVYSATEYFAGTLDRVVEVAGPKGPRLALLDIKTTAALPKHVGPQTAAYAIAYREMGLGDVAVRWCAHLQRTGRYELVPLRDPQDYAVWRAALTVRRWREQNDPPPRRRQQSPDQTIANVAMMAGPRADL